MTTGYPPPTRIEIHAAGRDIIIEHTGPFKAVSDRALALWRATAPKPGTKPPTEPREEGGGAGFVLADRSDPVGFLPAEIELPNRLADRGNDDDSRRADATTTAGQA